MHLEEKLSVRGTRYRVDYISDGDDDDDNDNDNGDCGAYSNDYEPVLSAFHNLDLTILFPSSSCSSIT